MFFSLLLWKNAFQTNRATKCLHFSVNWSFICLAFLMLAAGILMPYSLTARAASESDAFSKIWQHADGPIAANQVSRSWLWGARPNWTGYETYDQSGGGQRLVEYYDKSRMEINDPGADSASQWYVSNGLLTTELVSGKMQVGDNRFESYLPATIPVAGDLENNSGPTYAAFAPLTIIQGNITSNRTGRVLNEQINAQGQVNSFLPPMTTTYAYYEPQTQHNIPAVLWNWMQNIPGSNWTSALGYPISEAYWSSFKVGGVDKLVLVQLFQRRVLTYTPSNDPAWQVEMGNIGLHYFTWRYNGHAPAQIQIDSTRPNNNAAQLDSEEQSFLQTINAYRKADGLGELSFQPAIENASRWMSQDMAEKNYFSHTDSLNRDPFNRMAAFSFKSGWMGENIAAGKPTGVEVFNQFKASPGHNANMLKPEYTKIGIARYNVPGSNYGWYWTVDFGS